MNKPLATSWAAKNQALLVAEFARLTGRLGGERDAPPPPVMTPPAAIDALAEIFSLSAFERELLLLCAGVEMESSLAALCAERLGASRRGAPTFGMAVGVLSEPHWSALSPSSPLRRFRLIEMEPGQGVTTAPLRIDERVLHYLAGVNELDPRLEPALCEAPLATLMDERHRELAASLTWPAPDDHKAGLHLCGDDPSGQEAVAAVLARRVGRRLFVIRNEDAPAASADVDHFLQLWAREAALLPACLMLQWESETPSAAAKRLAERAPGLLILASREPVALHRRLERHDVSRPGPVGQKRLWREALGPEDIDEPALDDVSQQFRLSAQAIASIGAKSRTAGAVEVVWEACRSLASPRLSHLAQHIPPSARWDDLVLPQTQTHLLRQLANQSRQRMTVYETWGFSAKDKRGLGTTALFFGPSGTGKTLAAEVLAAELRLDLYRIDLSSVVSKYIGDTEKNLRQVFDAAETGGAVLLFDEADALFGKRAEVKDSHDRYANIEVGYLLQRMESFRGLAILTTNMKSSLDKSFERRLRFTIEFPFPDAQQREAIWSRAFPAAAPTADLRFDRLARLNVAGGSIRNIAINAAFLAAQSCRPIDMAHVLQATRIEAHKMERPLSEIEIRGWT